MAREVRLVVGDKPIELHAFAQGFLDRTIEGMLRALKDTGEIENLVISIEGDGVSMVLNGAEVSLNLFTGDIVRTTIIGMISSLRGVTSTSRVRIDIAR